MASAASAGPPKPTAAKTTASKPPSGKPLDNLPEPNEPVQWRLGEGFASELGQRTGEWILDHAPVAEGLLTAAQRWSSPFIIGLVLNEAGDLSKIPNKWAVYLTKKGFPPVAVRLANEYFENTFQGIRGALEKRGAKPGEQLTEADVSAGFQFAKNEIARRARAQKAKLMMAMKDVDKVKRTKFVELARTLTGEDKEKFDQYRTLIAGEPWIIEELADTPIDQWIPTLEGVLGKIKPSVTGRANEIGVRVINSSVDGAKTFFKPLLVAKTEAQRVLDHGAHTEWVANTRSRYEIPVTPEPVPDPETEPTGKMPNWLAVGFTVAVVVVIVIIGASRNPSSENPEGQSAPAGATAP